MHLTFDTNMNTPRYGYMPAACVARECITNYRLAVWRADGWEDLATVEGNYQRLRVHRFPTVTASTLRLIAEATGGHPSARLFGMRVYREPDALGAR